MTLHGRDRSRRSSLTVRAGEVLGVLAAPFLAYVILRPRLFSPPGLPDPSSHTTYIVDPQAMFERFNAALEPTARMREGARVGFLVPARIAYLLFGAIPGYIALRYVLALVAIVPAYLFLKRCYGRPAGVAAVVIVLSSPVMIVAWGTDYPNSSAVSYLIAALACVGLSFTSKRRALLLGSAGALFALATWSLATSALLGVAALACYFAIRLWRDRGHIVRDVAVIGVGAIVMTALLLPLSWALLGQFDYIEPTLHSITYLSLPSQKILWHSRNWRWINFDVWLLVPPTVFGVGFLVFFRRLKTLSSEALLVVASAGVEFAVSAWLQFGDGVEALEEHFWASLDWSAALLALAFVVAELTRGLAKPRVLAYLPAVALLAIPLVYESDPHVPAYKWSTLGLPVAFGIVLLAGAGTWIVRRLSVAGRGGLTAGMAGMALAVVLAGGLLVLTVTPEVPHALLPDTIPDPIPAYAASLGGPDSHYENAYRLDVDVPLFVGPPTYRNEQLLMWWPNNQLGPLLGPIGIYHSGFNSVSGIFPGIWPGTAAQIDRRKPAQILFMSTTGAGFGKALRALAPWGARFEKRHTYTAGRLHLHLELVDLTRYYHP